MSDRKSVLSCIQPTGYIHLGNYFGAVQNWVTLQEDYRCHYGVVDYHAMTMPYKPDQLRRNTWELCFKLLAVGIKPENLFVQSLVPEHTELGWILNCFCGYGNLTRMTQFKDKSSQVTEGGNDQYVSAGLFDYPVLQSADILIYKADFVPVGKDQDQHLELTRDIANRFNNMVGKEYFALPDTLHTETPKIRSTADPARKMSKSAGEKHYISLFEDEARVRKQIRSAVTDAGDTPEGQMSEGVDNLFTLLRASGNMTDHDQLMATYEDGTLRYSDLKAAVADTVVDLITPFKERYAEITADKKAVKNQIKASSHEIRKIAQQTLREVKELSGLLNVRG
jgi:tryptophanyl-tRNA synthetase